MMSCHQKSTASGKALTAHGIMSSAAAVVSSVASRNGPICWAIGLPASTSPVKDAAASSPEITPSLVAPSPGRATRMTPVRATANATAARPRSGSFRTIGASVAIATGARYTSTNAMATVVVLSDQKKATQ